MCPKISLGLNEPSSDHHCHGLSYLCIQLADHVHHCHSLHCGLHLSCLVTFWWFNLVNLMKWMTFFVSGCWNSWLSYEQKVVHWGHGRLWASWHLLDDDKCWKNDWVDCKESSLDVKNSRLARSGDEKVTRDTTIKKVCSSTSGSGTVGNIQTNQQYVRNCYKKRILT